MSTLVIDGSQGEGGEHLADQLLLPLALAGRGSFVTTRLTRHATTNMDVIRHFRNVAIESTREAGHVLVATGR